MRKTPLLVLVCLLGLMTVHAQTGDGRRDRLRRAVIQRFDTDHDGRLSEAEKEKLREKLRQRQASKDQPADTSPSSLRGLYGQQEPAGALRQVDLEIYDKARDKTLPVQVTYPPGEGKHPVIIWSHGLFGSQDNYQPLVQHWARHGYLVLQPSHSDSLTRGEGDLSTGMAGNVKDWASRPKDVSFLIDCLSSRQELAPYADTSRIGVAGHSFGGHTTVLVEGAIPAFGAPLSDSRVQAFVSVSPPGNSPLLPASAWKGLTRPTLFISGDNDDSPGGEKAPWRRESFEGCAPGDKYLLWVKDAHHNFGGISGAFRRGQSREPDQVEIVKSASLAFWDAYLRARPAAREVLVTGRLGGNSEGLYNWTVR